MILQTELYFPVPFGNGGDPELTALFNAASAGKAKFLVNAIDTETKGIDIVISHNLALGIGQLTNSLAATFSENEVVEYYSSRESC